MEKKLAGILCEARLAPDCVQSYVIGLGLNVLRGYFPPELSDIATSLRLIDAQTKWSRTELLISVLTAFFELWPLCLTQDRRLVTAYSLACMNIGRRVQATGEHGKRLEGCAEAIGEEGALLLRLRDGELRAVHSGEVLLLPEVLD